MIKKYRPAIPALAVFTVLFLVPALATLVHAPAGPTYTLSASPTKLNEIEYPIITFSITGGTASTSYTFQVTVTKPGSVGQAQNNLFLTTDTSGSGTGAVVYSPNYSGWNPLTGSVNTDIAGNYTTTVIETAPKSVTTGFPTATFQVVSALAVAIITPTVGSSIQRGNTVDFIATVSDVNSQPVTDAQVSVSSPSGGQVTLSPTTPSGTYSGAYRVLRSDPSGTWNITATAYSPSPSTTENFGKTSIGVNVTPSQLIITTLSTYNEYGSPTADFSPADTVYASFSISFPAGGYLMNGSFIANVEDPSGSTVTTLTCIFDPSRNLFYTPSGFQVSSSDPSGDWELVFPAQSVTDQYGNSGPSTTITFRFVVHAPASNQTTISPFYFAIAALVIGGGLGTTVFLKRFNSTTGPFEDLFKLTGGEMQPATTLMITSDSGGGSTTMGLQLLYRELSKGKFCGLLSYDAFPSEISRRMRDMGWDISDFVKTGQLKILDCYSALAGVEGSLIRDATDFTEVSIQITHLIEKAKGPVTLLLDSITPIFNSSPPKDCINFLQVIGAKIKNSNGTFIFTATKGSIPEEARSKIEALADGVIEMNLTKRSNSLTRTLQVKKMSGHQASSVETGFEIKQGKGIVIRKQRIRIGLFRS